MSSESTGHGEPDRTLRLLWRHRLGDPVGSRGPKQRTSVDVVVDTAIEIADEEGMEALRVIRGLDSDAVGFVYVAAHTFHYGDDAPGIIAAAGPRLGAFYAADTFDHRRSHGLRYITNPPGSPARVHQHMRIGAGDVDWDEGFDALAASGFLAREDAMRAHVELVTKLKAAE